MKDEEVKLIDVEVLRRCNPFGDEVDPGAIIKIPVAIARVWQDAGVVKVVL